MGWGLYKISYWHIFSCLIIVIIVYYFKNNIFEIFEILHIKKPNPFITMLLTIIIALFAICNWIKKPRFSLKKHLVIAYIELIVFLPILCILGVYSFHYFKPGQSRYGNAGIPFVVIWVLIWCLQSLSKEYKQLIKKRKQK